MIDFNFLVHQVFEILGDIEKKGIKNGFIEYVLDLDDNERHIYNQIWKDIKGGVEGEG